MNGTPQFTAGIFLIVATGCGTDFDTSLIEGNWRTTELRFGDDGCGIAEALNLSISEQVYTFGIEPEVWPDDEEGDSDETKSAEELAQAGADIWNQCERYYGDPNFQCEFFLPLIHFDTWSSGLDSFRETLTDAGVLDQCENDFELVQFSGTTEGLFIDEQNAFFTSRLELRCSDVNELARCDTSLVGELEK